MARLSDNRPRKRLLAQLSQAVETLRLRREPNTHIVPLKGSLNGKVRVEFYEVSDRDFDHFENISNALIRLDKGIYGRCGRCGRRIEEEVLATASWATECRGCADQVSHR